MDKAQPLLLVVRFFLRGTTYLWSTGATTISITVSPTATTSYSVTATYNGSTVCSASATVTVNPLPTASITGSDSICTGSSTTLTASGGGTYLWSTAATSASINVSPTSTTTYTVTVTSSLGCTKTAQKTVNVSPTSVGGTVSGGTTICSGNTCTLNLSGNTGHVIKWQKGYFSFEYQNHYSVDWSDIENTAGLTTYTTEVLSEWKAYRAVIQSGVCPIAYSVFDTVLVNPLPTLGGATQSAAVCAGSGATINLTGLLASRTFTVSYSVNGVAQTPITGVASNTSGSASFTTVALTAGNNGQTLQITGITTTSTTPNCSQSFTQNVTLSVNPLPTLGGATQSAAVCAGSSATINLTGLLASRTFTVSYSVNGVAQTPVTGVASNTSGSASFTTVALTAGNNGQTLQITGITTTSTTPNCSQSFTQNVTLSVNPLPTLGGATQSAAVCAGSSATINLTGLLASRTFTVSYSVNGVAQTPVAGVASNTSGSASFTTVALTAGNNGQTLQITGITTTSTTPNCSQSFTQNVTLSVNPLPTASISGSDSICTGSSTTLTASGGGTYLWSTAATSASINVSPTSTTTYTVTVTSSLGCTKTAQKTVNVSPTSVGGTVSGGTIICPGSTSGVLTLSGHTGSIVRWESSVSPFTTWTTISNTSTTYTSGALTATTQFRAVVKSGVCAEANSTATTVSINIAIGGTVTGDTSICEGSSSGLLTLSGYTAASIVMWQSSVSPFSSWNDIENYTSTYISDVLTESIQFRAVVQSGLCAYVYSNPIFITVNALPKATAGNNSPVCAGSTLNLNSSGGVSYSWSGPNNFTSTAQNPSIPSATTSASGTYTVTVTNSSGCTSTAATTVTVNPLPTLTGATQSAAVCAGSSATINLTGLLASRTFTVSYSVNGVAQTPVAGVASNTSGSASFTTVALTAGNNGQTLQITGITTTSTTPNCNQSFTQNVTLAVNPLPTLGGATQSAAVCAGSSATINLTGLLASRTFTVSYSVNGVNQTPVTGVASNTSGSASFTTVALTAGNNGQTLKITGITTTSTTPNCSQSFAQNVILSVNPLPMATAESNSPICIGTTLNLAASGGTGYSWSGPNGFTSSLQDPTISGATVAASGTYTVTVTNSSGCTSTAQVAVVVNTLSTATAGSNSPVCAGATLNLTSSGGTSFNWTGPSTFYSTEKNPTFENVSIDFTGTYTVKVSDENGCTSTAQIEVQVNQPQITDIADNLICVGGTINLRSNGGVSYSWTGPQFSSTKSVNTISNAVASQSGTYTVVVTDAGGCTSSAVSIVQVFSNPVIEAGSDISICYGSSASLTASGGNTYLWNNGESASSITVSPQSTTIYNVEGTNLAGCKSVDQVQVTVYPAIPLFSLTATPSNCVKGGIIKLSGSEIGVSYQLLLDGSAIGSSQAGTGELLDFGTVSAGGTYTIKATRTSDGCERVMSGSYIIE